ncbi:MAG: two-component regulator propeller domain-containing protein, partial [Bacteroidota bacterium]
MTKAFLIGSIAQKSIYTFMLLFLGVAKVSCQDKIQFQHISTLDGLSQNDVNTIYQDKLGFMWFGTHDGLNKYDGYDFTIYKPGHGGEESISSNLIFKIAGDRNNNLWIGTTGKGLNFFDRSAETFRSFTHDHNKTHGLGNDHITDLLVDHKNRLWVATNKELNMLDLDKPLDSAIFHRYHLEQGPRRTGWDGKLIYDVFEDNKNQLWVAGVEGLHKLARDQNGDIYFKSMNETLALPHSIVGSIVQDRLGRLVIGTNMGLYMQKETHDLAKVQKISDGNFNTLLLDNQGNIWGGTYDGLLYYENPTNTGLPELTDRFVYNPLDQNSISKNIIKSLFLDQSGIIWVGTNGGGVNKFDPERKQFLHIRKTLADNSLSYDKIRAMYEDSRGDIWIGTEGGGLNFLLSYKNDRRYDNFKSFQTVPKTFALQEINMKGEKKMLIGSEGNPGLHIVDIKEPEKIREQDIIAIPEIEHSVFTILEDRDGILWIGTYGGGLLRWIPEEDGYRKDIFTSNTLDYASISSDIIRNIFEDDKGILWIGTGNGLCRLDPSQKRKMKPRFEVFQNLPGNPETLSHNYILAIYQSKAGDLWVGTFGGGLNKYVPSL